MTLHGMNWNPAARWWGRGSGGVPLELDVVAESSDRRHLLVGEVKWTERFHPASVLADLKRKAKQVPFRGGRRVHFALWVNAAPPPRSMEYPSSGRTPCWTKRQEGKRALTELAVEDDLDT